MTHKHDSIAIIDTLSRAANRLCAPCLAIESGIPQRRISDAIREAKETESVVYSVGRQ